MGDVYDAQRIAERIEERLLPLVTRLQKKKKEYEEREQQRARQREKEQRELSMLQDKVREQQEGCLCDGDYVPLWELAWQLYDEDESVELEERQQVKDMSEALWNKFLGVVPITSAEARERYSELLSLYNVPALVLSSTHTLPQRTSFFLHQTKREKIKLVDRVIFFDIVTPQGDCHTFFFSPDKDNYFGSVDKEKDIRVAHTFMKKLPLRQRIVMMLPFISDEQLTLGTSLLLTQEITRRQLSLSNPPSVTTSSVKVVLEEDSA